MKQKSKTVIFQITWIAMACFLAVSILGCSSTVDSLNEPASETAVAELSGEELSLAEEIASGGATPFEMTVDVDLIFAGDAFTLSALAPDGVDFADADVGLVAFTPKDSLVNPTDPVSELMDFQHFETLTTANLSQTVDEAADLVFVMAFSVGNENYAGFISIKIFADSSSGNGDPGPGNTIMQSSVSQNGITWTFDQAYPVGQFVNGDYYVVTDTDNEVVVINIDPATTQVSGRWVVQGSHSHSDLAQVNGSELDPVAGGGQQPYDERLFWRYHQGSFDQSKNVAAALPLTISGVASLVSSKGRQMVDEIQSGGFQNALEEVSVLTIMNDVPAEGSFRPPYVAVPNKNVSNNLSDVNFAVLPELPVVASTPTPSESSGIFQGIRIGDKFPDWKKQYAASSQGAAYGREYARDVGKLASLTVLDIPAEQKSGAVINLVQLGLDLFAIATNGGNQNWKNNGGHHQGRLFAILFAGFVLGRQDLMDVGSAGETEIAFGEKQQMFYVEETSSGVYNFGVGGYGPEHVGMPEWGQRHATDPAANDNVSWNASYRHCCTGNSLYGELAASLILGIDSLWNDDALFDYQSRFLQKQEQIYSPGSSYISNDLFGLNVWKEYASDYRSPWPSHLLF